MKFENGDSPAVVPEALIVGPGTAAEVADFVLACLGDIEAALSPVVGTGGVRALLARSVHLAGARHVWLRNPVGGSTQTLDPGALRQRLMEQSLGDAKAGGDDLLHTVRTLLSSLIGASLTNKLLQSAWRRFLPEPDENGVSS